MERKIVINGENGFLINSSNEINELVDSILFYNRMSFDEIRDLRRLTRKKGEESFEVSICVNKFIAMIDGQRVI